MKQLLFLCSIFLFLSVSVASQQRIQGNVLDHKNEPLAFANLSLFHISDTSFITGTTTNNDGYFILEAVKKGEYLLRVQYVGFEDFQQFIVIEALDLQLNPIRMTTIENELAEVVVTAQVPIIEKRGDRILFNVSSSPLNSGYDGLELLERTPNVWVNEEGGITMRQSTPLIMVNGRRINLPASEVGDYLKNLNAENVLRIEIQTNTDASRDAETGGGVINIILKKVPLGFNGNLRADYQFRGQGIQSGFAGINFNYGANKWSLYGSYNHRNQEVASARIYETFYTKIDEYLKTLEDQLFAADRHRYQLGFLIEPFKNHEFGLEVYGNLADFDRREKSNLWLLAASDTLAQGSSISSNLADNNILNGVFNYTIKLDTLGSNLKFIADFTNHQNDQLFNFESVYDGFLNNNTERNNFAALSDIFILQPEWNKHFRKGLKLKLGGKWTQIKRDNDIFVEEYLNNEWIENDRTSTLNYKEKVTAGFFTLSQSFKENYFIKIGLRAEYTDLERQEDLQVIPLRRNYINWFPSFYLSREFDKNSSLSFSYDRGLRRPSFGLLTNKFTKVNDFNYSTGNPDLQPEFRGSYDLSYQVKKNTFSLFFNNTSDAINGVYLLEDQITTYIPLNQGAQRSFGGSYNRSGSLLDWWFLSSGLYLYHRNFKDESGAILFPQTTFSGNVSNNFKLGKTTSIDVSASYTGRRKDAYYIADPYYRFNLMLKKSFLEKRLNLRIYLQDIFNLRQFSTTRPFEDFYTVYASKPLSRGIRFWLSYKFDNSYKVKNGKAKSGNDAKGRLE